MRTFEAGSRSEAMQFTCDLCGRGAYTTVHAVDHDPYPEDWARRQRGEN